MSRKVVFFLAKVGLLVNVWRVFAIGYWLYL